MDWGKFEKIIMAIIFFVLFCFITILAHQNHKANKIIQHNVEWRNKYSNAEKERDERWEKIMKDREKNED